MKGFLPRFRLVTSVCALTPLSKLPPGELSTSMTVCLQLSTKTRRFAEGETANDCALRGLSLKAVDLFVCMSRMVGQPAGKSESVV
ncbi:uncharacterized protein K441DRAFT_651462, partial [Cenococcum geophilum 1.58]|uniref:uncharacterized protein n=1 Tax=Cenococcum geophilum 1.58 TaxID=794803 RepID=UPI00358FA999